MADPFVAEIRIFGFNFAPKGWAFCNGQLLPLAQNTALFSLLGTTYGGDGKNTFALPNLQGNAPMHPGQGPGLSLHDLGETGGSETVTLLESEIPAHPHSLMSQAAVGNRTQPDWQRDRARARGNGICPHRSDRGATRFAGGDAGGRRSAAQQHAALSDAQLLHRTPGGVSAAAIGMRVALRPVRASDEPFLLCVYAGTRAEELAPVPWTPEQKAAFVAQQFAAQTAHYAQHYAGMSADVILVDDEPAGRLLVARWADEIRIVDISILPELRGRGAGTVLLRQLLDEADGASASA